nr:basic proline-rich protein-like [Equus asinus]
MAAGEETASQGCRRRRPSCRYFSPPPGRLVAGPRQLRPDTHGPLHPPGPGPPPRAPRSPPRRRRRPPRPRAAAAPPGPCTCLALPRAAGRPGPSLRARGAGCAAGTDALRGLLPRAHLAHSRPAPARPPRVPAGRPPPPPACARAHPRPRPAHALADTRPRPPRPSPPPGRATAGPRLLPRALRPCGPRGPFLLPAARPGPAPLPLKSLQRPLPSVRAPKHKRMFRFSNLMAAHTQSCLLSRPQWLHRAFSPISHVNNLVVRGSPR